MFPWQRDHLQLIGSDLLLSRMHSESQCLSRNIFRCHHDTLVQVLPHCLDELTEGGSTPKRWPFQEVDVTSSFPAFNKTIQNIQHKKAFQFWMSTPPAWQMSRLQGEELEPFGAWGCSHVNSDWRMASWVVVTWGPPVDRKTDRHVWKHYLPAILIAGGKK